MTYEVPHIIDGKATTTNNAKLEIFNPALGAVQGHVHTATQKEVDAAVAAAKAAFPAWSAKTPAQRAKIMFNFKYLLEQHIDELAEYITKEHGKTRPEAIGDVRRGIDVVDFTTNIPYHLRGDFTDEVASGMDCYSLNQPLGVCVGITPFNFPAMIPLWMFPMAIACGNTFVLKPSEKDPSCSARMVALAKEAGVPDGVVNMINGDKAAVDGLIMHPDVQAVSFVGSSTVAEYVYTTAITHGKRAQAFGGAKNHCILMPDADMEQATNAILESAYGCAGERCMAISVVVAVGDEVADQLVQHITPLIENLKVGDGMGKDMDMGPLVTKPHWERVQSYVELGKKEGATVVADNSQFKPSGNEEGFFMGACLFDHVKPDMRIYQEEIFGPVLSIVRAKNFEEALQLINDHQYGNGTSIFTRDGYIGREFAQRVQAGMVGINVPVPVPVAYHSFGGWKNSIFADTQMYGADSVKFYTKKKKVLERWYA